MRRRTWVQVACAEEGEVGGMDEGRGFVEAHISEARCGAPGTVALLTVTATLSGAWVEASVGRGEKASSGMAVVLRVQFEGMDASSRWAMF